MNCPRVKVRPVDTCKSPNTKKMKNIEQKDINKKNFQYYILGIVVASSNLCFCNTADFSKEVLLRALYLLILLTDNGQI